LHHVLLFAIIAADCFNITNSMKYFYTVEEMSNLLTLT